MIFIEVAGGLLSSILRVGNLIFAYTAWVYACAILVGIAVTSVLIRKTRRAQTAVALSGVLTLAFASRVFTVAPSVLQPAKRTAPLDVGASVVSSGYREVMGRWETEDGAQFVEFFPDNRCTRTEFDIQGKGWKTIKGGVRVATDGGIFCSSSEGGNGVYVVRGANFIALDYGMGGESKLFHRVDTATATTASEATANGRENSGSSMEVWHPPTVISSALGQYSLRLTQNQQSAVSLFLTTHPDLQMADCQTLGYAADSCGQAYADWKTLVMNAKAEVQYPYASWGDFNRDGLLDIVLPFFGRTTVNNWGWRRWYIVVFQGMPDGRFAPVIAAEDQWGVCFDGMLYHPVRQQIEYWCKSGGGFFRWNGSEYVAKRLIGD